jgi:hypothetical protein
MVVKPFHLTHSKCYQSILLESGFVLKVSINTLIWSTCSFLLYT